MKTLLLTLSLLLALGPGAAAAADAPVDPADAAAATAVVESFHEALLGSMKEADTLGFQGRYDRVLASLDQSFDLPLMARVSIGSTWKELDPAQQEAFVALSRRLSASKYADNFDGYGDQRFETRSHEAGAVGTIVVKTVFVQPDDDDVAFAYRLRKTDDGWRVIDVQIDEKVSEITLRRADYRAVIQRDGFDALMKALEEKIAKHAAG